MSNTINPERVHAIFLDCLSKEGEDTSKYVKAEGINTNVRFNSKRLNRHKAEIKTILDELPDSFKNSGGGGMSFLNACNDRHGNQWTGLHLRMEQLFQLGVGVGKAKLFLPRELWRILPGEMPYYVIK